MSMMKNLLGLTLKEVTKKACKKQALICIFTVTAKLSEHSQPVSLSDP